MVVSDEFSSSEENTSSSLEKDEATLRRFANFALRGEREGISPPVFRNTEKVRFYFKTTEFLDDRTRQTVHQAALARPAPPVPR